VNRPPNVRGLRPPSPNLTIVGRLFGLVRWRVRVLPDDKPPPGPRADRGGSRIHQSQAAKEPTAIPRLGQNQCPPRVPPGHLVLNNPEKLRLQPKRSTS